MQQEPMTSNDYDTLTALLNDMKLVQRPKILVAVEEARQLGDLKENAEYHAAKEEQANITQKIAELEDLITRVIIIDPAALAHNKISFGSSVVLIDLDTDKEIHYTIVGSQETSPENGLISFNSPLAKQLVGKEEGDEVKAKLPAGIKEFEVEKVYYKD